VINEVTKSRSLFAVNKDQLSHSYDKCFNIACDIQLAAEIVG